MTALPEIPKSFVTTIRVNLIEIARIALFLEKHDYHMTKRSRSKLAATGLHLIANQLSEFPVETTEEAVRILRRLNYGESLVQGRRDFKPLLKQLSKENIHLDTVESEAAVRESQETLNADALRLTKGFNRGHSPVISAIDKERAESILAPAENESEPEPEAPQLRTRTADDEKKDISKLRTAIGNFSGAPVLEENTGRAGQ